MRTQTGIQFPGIKRTVTTSDGVSLSVREYGPRDAAHTVVLLHGLCLNKDSWTIQIGHLLRQYGDSFRIISYDHRGHGDSAAAPMQTYHIDQLATDLADLLVALSVTGPLTLAGHSMGGMVALVAPGSPRRPATCPTPWAYPRRHRGGQTRRARPGPAPGQTRHRHPLRTHRPRTARRRRPSPSCPCPTDLRRLCQIWRIRYGEPGCACGGVGGGRQRHPGCDGLSACFKALRPVSDAEFRHRHDSDHQWRRGPAHPAVACPRPGSRHPRGHARAPARRRAHALG
ncbi:MAG: hypothetical protein QOJ56_3489 [Mycobacterium sp.]|nr:hypothetical protein [Mycobacterium sp.]